MPPRRGLPALALGLATLIMLVSVGSEGGPPEDRGPSTDAPSAGTREQPEPQATYDNPFAYCGAIGTVDQPGAPYVGDPNPTDVFLGLADITDLPPDAPERTETPDFHWRCMDGFVYACTYGPNLPCGKADLSSRATPEMIDFCAEHFDGTPLPGSLVGHQTIYGWVCRGETPATTHQKYQVDPQGFVVSFWHWIPEPEPGAPTAGVGSSPEPAAVPSR